MTRGVLQLRSGRWSWTVLEVRDLPSNRVETRYISFRLAGRQESHMRLQIPGGLSEIDETVLQSSARHPDSRYLVDDNDEHWEVYPFDRAGVGPIGGPGDFEMPPCEVVFRSNEGGHGRSWLPPDCGLGEATDDELLEIVDREAIRR